MKPFKIKPLLSLFCFAAALTTGSTSASASLVLTGVSSNDGWDYIGNSRDGTNVIYARGGAANFDTYLTSFTLSASDTFSNPGATVQGSPVGSLVSGSWSIGDRIIGLGVSDPDASLDQLNSAFFKLDFGGTGGWAAATTLDGSDGVGSFSAGGDGSVIGQSIQSGNTFAPFGSGHRAGGANIFAPVFSSALRSFAVIEDDFFYSDMQFLVNYDELARLSIPVVPFGDPSKFVVNASGLTPQGATIGADVAFSANLDFSTTDATVATPGTLALLLLGLVGSAGLRRRH